MNNNRVIGGILVVLAVFLILNLFRASVLTVDIISSLNKGIKAVTQPLTSPKSQETPTFSAISNPID